MGRFLHNIYNGLQTRGKNLALLASWSFHREPTVKQKNFLIENVISITKNRLYKQFKCVKIVLKQTFCPKMAKIAPKLNKVSPKIAKIIHI